MRLREKPVLGGGKKTEPSKRELYTNESNHDHENQKIFFIKLNKIHV
jgi:hypothetical protein